MKVPGYYRVIAWFLNSKEYAHLRRRFIDPIGLSPYLGIIMEKETTYSRTSVGRFWAFVLCFTHLIDASSITR